MRWGNVSARSWTGRSGATATPAKDRSGAISTLRGARLKAADQLEALVCALRENEVDGLMLADQPMFDDKRVRCATMAFSTKDDARIHLSIMYLSS